MASSSGKFKKPSYGSQGLDMNAALMNDLYDSIEKNPPGIEPKRVLVEWFLAAGWMDSAKELIRELRQLCPYDEQIRRWYNENCLDSREFDVEEVEAEVDGEAGASNGKGKGKESGSALHLSYIKVEDPAKTRAAGRADQDFDTTKADFERDVREFKLRSKRLLFFMHLRQKNLNSPGLDGEIKALDGFSVGKIGSTLRTLPKHKGNAALENVLIPMSGSNRPDGARVVAIKLAGASPSTVAKVAMDDFEGFIKWNKSQPGAKQDEDSLKSLLMVRKKLIEQDIPEALRIHTDNAMMHLDREIFKKKYVNDETMYGDAIKDISRENFICTEDGYAWDMEELSAAIKANDGVMRNPLSKHMFTPSDIRCITNHPHGRLLRALQIEQSKLRKGIRPKTIEEMLKLSKAYLEDMDDEAVRSRQATDEFLAYMATLPEDEQKSLDCLKVPAKDSHTGMAFDGTIGESVRDAKANKLCFHKAGDFIKQAANHLKRI
jgi:hypothetical protein